MLQEAVRDALRGRGRSRREAAETVLARARTAPAEVVPLVLAVRDELAAEEAPPRGLAGRVDALLLAVAASSEEGIAKAERGERRAQRGRQPSPSLRAGERAGRVLAQLLRVAPDPVLTIRASGRVGIWNTAGVSITGRRRRELRDAGPRSLFQRSDDYDALLEDLERDGRAEPSETVLLSAGGAEVPVRVFAQRIELPIEDGRDPDRYLLYLHDLTEVHRIRRRLIETEKLSAMAKIAGSVAHEFRNPLNSLFLSADLLEDELAGRDAGEAITPTLTAIREEVERLNQIINHYLALSKVESTDPVIVDLGETVQAFAEEWREKSDETPIELRVKRLRGGRRGLRGPEPGAARPREPDRERRGRPHRLCGRRRGADTVAHGDLRRPPYAPFRQAHGQGQRPGHPRGGPRPRVRAVLHVPIPWLGTRPLPRPRDRAGPRRRDPTRPERGARHLGGHALAPSGDPRRMTSSTDVALCILIVDDDRNSRESLSRALTRDGYEILSAENGKIALEVARENEIDLVLTDLKMPGLDGLGFLEGLRVVRPDVPAILISAYASVDTAVKAVRRGVSDVLEKPIRLRDVRRAIKRVVETHRLVGRPRHAKRVSGSGTTLQMSGSRLIGRAPRSSRCWISSSRVAPVNSTALLLGESGTGKEVIADAIHDGSLRRNGPLVKVACAALAEGVLEAELFGSEKGAYTGAHALRKGRFELAHGGTLFLDEVGEIPLPLQVKLLRVLQEGEFERVGGTETIKTDVRVITATNRDLEDGGGAGRFREDLYWRLNVIAIRVPPLRDRPEDIPVLAQHFLEKALKSTGQTRNLALADEVLPLLSRYRWPGNVRELENAMERAVVLVRGDLVTPDDLPETLRRVPGDPSLQRAAVDPLRGRTEPRERSSGRRFAARWTRSAAIERRPRRCSASVSPRSTAACARWGTSPNARSRVSSTRLPRRRRPRRRPRRRSPASSSLRASRHRVGTYRPGACRS